MDPLLPDREEVRSLLDYGESLAALAEGFIALSAGTVHAPARIGIEVSCAGPLLVKPAWLPGSDLTVKLVSPYPGNGERGIPTVEPPPAECGELSGLDPARPSERNSANCSPAACSAGDPRMNGWRNLPG